MNVESQLIVFHHISPVTNACNSSLSSRNEMIIPPFYQYADHQTDIRREPLPQYTAGFLAHFYDNKTVNQYLGLGCDPLI